MKYRVFRVPPAIRGGLKHMDQSVCVWLNRLRVEMQPVESSCLWFKGFLSCKKKESESDVYKIIKRGKKIDLSYKQVKFIKVTAATGH